MGNAHRSQNDAGNEMPHTVNATRAMVGRIAALSRWAREDDPQTATAPARRGFLARFEREVDPDGLLDPQERAVRAERERRAYMTRLALKSADVRRQRKAAGRRPGRAA